ncbi:PREDICTED: uncharacterized protein LOC108374801 [Rhagoletis zephyria]|uniref:uncharacterized protein LOC108374801 n=1 Tax=Rhagoletis zephyria TaxID=28612 RepID=UPI0008119F7A|nr:PREDICTED: uncharacterized protein LOC108374801 [Rhagoletis zephyria]
MSTHTMPPLNLLAADFVKCFLKTADLVAKEDKTTDEAETLNNTAKTKYKRRKMLNGGAGAAFMNGHGGSDSDDESDDDDEEGEAKNANASYANHSTSAIDEDVEMVDEATALKRRKSLLVKGEQMSAAATVPQRSDNEAQLKRIAASSLEVEF